MADDATTIKITRSTKERLSKYGKMGDSYEDVLVKVLDRLEELENKEGEHNIPKDNRAL